LGIASSAVRTAPIVSIVVSARSTRDADEKTKRYCPAMRRGEEERW
jgi:hypothetical protein